MCYIYIIVRLLFFNMDLVSGAFGLIGGLSGVANSLRGNSNSGGRSVGSYMAGYFPYKNSTKNMSVEQLLSTAPYAGNITPEMQFNAWYNSPAQQVARYRAAGLNPNLIAGQISNGNTTYTGDYDSSSNSFSRFNNVLQGVSGLAGNLFGVLSRREQQNLAKEQLVNLAEQQEFENATKMLNLQIQREQLRALQIRNNNSIMGNIPITTKPFSDSDQEPTFIYDDFMSALPIIGNVYGALDDFSKGNFKSGTKNITKYLGQVVGGKFIAPHVYNKLKSSLLKWLVFR